MKLSATPPPFFLLKRAGFSSRRPMMLRRLLPHVAVWSFLLGLCSWAIYAQAGNPSVPQGGSATFAATGTQTTTLGAAEIAAPDGTVVAVFPSVSGGTVNDWSLSVGMTSGYGSAPQFTVTAPIDAAVGVNYEVRVNSYYWAAGSARFDVVAGTTATPTPTPTPEATPTPTPDPEATPTPTAEPDTTTTPQGDPKPNALIRVADEGIPANETDPYTGGNHYNGDGENQSVAQDTVPTYPAIYHLRIQNDGGTEATFKVTGEGGSTNWNVKYFDALRPGFGTGFVRGSEITEAVTGAGWELPQPLAPGAFRELRVEVTPALAVPVEAQKTIAITVADGATRHDVVKATTTRIRALQKLQYKDNYTGGPWTDVPPANEAGYSVLAVEARNILFRAVRPASVSKWPREKTDPFQYRPAWKFGANSWYGEEYATVFDKPTTGNAFIAVEVECGDKLSFKIKVRPSFRLHLNVAKSGITAGGGSGDAARMNLTAEVEDGGFNPVPGTTVRFFANYSNGSTAGTISAAGTADDKAVTDATGNATVTLISGQAGDVEVFARIYGSNGEIWAESHKTWIRFVQPQTNPN